MEQQYSQNNRFYHTLTHLKSVIRELIAVKKHINDWDTVLFSVFYHDFIYDTLRNDNELKSAEAAESRLRLMGIEPEKINRCKQQILATSAHRTSKNSDTNYFTDADLAVLGKSWNVYRGYMINIRKEYSNYPDNIYEQGRRNVLEHFLAMKRIFKTSSFYKKYEKNARRNLIKEISVLKKTAQA